MPIDTNNNLVSMNEVYFGKTDGMLKLEAQLDKLRKKYGINTASSNSDPDLIKFNRMMEEEFGFGCFNLNVTFDVVPNAFTIPIDHSFNAPRKRDKFIISNGHIKFKKEYDYACLMFITTGLIYNPYFTTGEVMASIMHEIGHNFYSCLNRMNGVLSAVHSAAYLANIFAEYIQKFMKIEDADIHRNIKDAQENKLTLSMLYGVFQQTTYFTKLQAKARNTIQKNNGIAQVLLDYVDYVTTIGVFIGSKFAMIKRFIDGTIKLKDFIFPIKKFIAKAMNPFTWIMLPLSYSEERTADNFSTMYGYAPELSSFLNKTSTSGQIENTQAIINKVPFVAMLFNTVMIPNKILTSALDPHPDGISRVYDQIKMLEYELSKADIDPKMRAVIKDDIKACKIQIAKLTDISKGLQDPDIAQHIYNKALSDASKGVGFKEFIIDDKKKFERYDKTYDIKTKEVNTNDY